jgi:hypothetical protein
MVRSAATPRVSNHEARWMPEASSFKISDSIFKQPIRFQNRHCDPTGRANARPTTGSAKQSRKPTAVMALDCFVAFAPRNDVVRLRALAARMAPELLREPSRIRGRRECWVRSSHPQPRVRNKKAHERSHHRYTASTGIPRAMVLTAYIVLSPVTGLFCHRRRRNYFRQLDTSVGAPGPHDFAVRFGFVRL